MASEAEDKMLARLHASWQWRVEQWTQGNATLLGAVHISMLGRRPHFPPAFLGTAQINKDGIVCCNMMGKSGHLHVMLPIMPITEMRDGFRRIADELRLSDTDRTELFTELQKWISKDWRAKSDANTF